MCQLHVHGVYMTCILKIGDYEIVAKSMSSSGLQVTYGDPRARLPYLKSNGVHTFHWDIKLHVTRKGSPNKLTPYSISNFFISYPRLISHS